MQHKVAIISFGISAIFFSAPPAPALQPAAEFLAHARHWNPRNRAARATTAERDAEVGISTGSLLPNLSATGSYTRNQYEVTTAALVGGAPAGLTFPNIVIQPQNQLDANVVVNVPLVDVGSWDRRAAAKATLEGARADEAGAVLMVEKNVIRDYYTLLGQEAVLLSAKKNVEIAVHNVKLARDREQNGTGSELDVQRALADRAKAEQSVTAAQLGVDDTRQDLYSLSGIAPEPASSFPVDDLHEEAPLDSWMALAAAVPSVQSAAARRAAAEETDRAVKAALLPTISGMGEERLTNATAFVGGHSSVYLVQVSASWKLDTTIGPELRARSAAVAAARADEESAKQAAADAVFRDWQQIHADIASARLARAQVDAADLAASLAEDRYEGGVATQIDLLQARQDAFSADVARIQADSDLAYARTALRLDAAEIAGQGP